MLHAPNSIHRSTGFNSGKTQEAFRLKKSATRKAHFREQLKLIPEKKKPGFPGFSNI